ncbi:MAG: hypothetical protein ACOVJ8_09085 [Sediminibacterium sp.]
MSEAISNARPLNERMAIVETQIVNLQEEVKGIKDEISSLTKAAWGVVLAIAAWAIIQLYVGIQPNNTNVQNEIKPPAISSKLN